MSETVATLSQAPRRAAALPLDAFALPVAVLDARGRVVEANRAFAALLGADSARPGATLDALLTDGTDGAVRPLIAAALAGTVAPAGAARLDRPGAGAPAADLAYTCKADGDGGLVLTLDAPAVQRRFQDFAEAANDWFWETDARHRFTWTSNHDAPLAAGLARPPLGATRWDLGDTSLDPEAWHRHRQDMEAHRPFRDFQYWVILANGARHRLSVSGKPVFAADGTFLGYRGSTTDVTWRSSAEARALWAETQLRDAIAAMEDGFVIYDAEDRFVMANRPYVDLYPGIAHLFVPGTRFEDVLRGGLACGTFVLPQGQTPEDWLAGRLRAHREGVVGLEQQLGDGRWVAIKERRTAEGGTVGIRTDITEQKRREQTLRDAVEEARLADRVKSEFLANMSHELRTPLNAIIGFSEVMTCAMFGPLGDARYATYAQDIHASGRHLLAVISDILDLSRIEAGELRLDHAPLDLSVLAADALRMVAPRAAEKRVVLVNRLSEEEAAGLPAMTGDSLRLKQVLLNLLSNAVKFTPAGGTVAVGHAVPGDGTIHLTVTDSGIGMSAEDLAVAMAPFGQVQSAFSRQYQGTGLGLPIAARLVEAHGGRLELSSVPGSGTTAAVVLPTAAAQIPE
ncbi:ATP-binding protein [Novispirillum sp. DQ9]|uniref:sensor histidine kinase n=1 Tax=Novispirillum sp. DQ9 TaxID=3398612 RepID=UPI003C7DDECA